MFFVTHRTAIVFVLIKTMFVLLCREYYVSIGQIINWLCVIITQHIARGQKIGSILLFITITTHAQLWQPTFPRPYRDKRNASRRCTSYRRTCKHRCISINRCTFDVNTISYRKPSPVIETEGVVLWWCGFCNTVLCYYHLLRQRSVITG